MENVKTAIINGITLCFNANTGALCGMSGIGNVKLIENGDGNLSVANPTPKFEALRAAGKYGKSADIKMENDKVTVTWEKLALNSNAELCSDIFAQVTYKADDDGKSIVLSCTVTNSSVIPIRQVVFPEFTGITAIEGIESTRFTSCGLQLKPFKELSDGEDTVGFYGETDAVAGKILKSGTYFWETMIGRWYDLGGFHNGFSLYRKHWGFGRDDMSKCGEGDETFLKLNQQTKTLMIASLHKVRIEQNGTWESGDYILTPHIGGWANGIIPYRNWVRQNVNRAVPLPKHIREGIGFRSIWCSQQNPAAQDSIKWFFDDFKDIAEDMTEHGLYELVPWQFGDFKLPLSSPYFNELGGEKAYEQAVSDCKGLSVNVAPFVSFMSLYGESSARYGQEPSKENSWTYHTSMIPVFRPEYGESHWAGWAVQDNELWKSDVKNAFYELKKSGSASICWDQFFLYNHEDGLYNLVREFRKDIYKEFPQATFSGEATGPIELECDLLDYTWNWCGWPGNGDMRGYNNAFETPRLNITINRNPRDVKLAFMDNLFMNIMPSKIGDINGSAFIREFPALSLALKQCATMKKRYLAYFTEGVCVGDCVLSKASSCRVTAYRLKNEFLVFVMNENGGNILYADLDLSCLIGAGKYKLMAFDMDNVLIDEIALASLEHELKYENVEENTLIAVEIREIIE